MQAAVVVILNTEQRQRTVGITDASQGQRRGRPPSHPHHWILPFYTGFVCFNQIEEIYSLNYIPAAQTLENSISEGSGVDTFDA